MFTTQKSGNQSLFAGLPILNNKHVISNMVALQKFMGRFSSQHLTIGAIITGAPEDTVTMLTGISTPLRDKLVSWLKTLKIDQEEDVVTLMSFIDNELSSSDQSALSTFIMKLEVKDV